MSIETLRGMIAGSQDIVFLGGAGVSTESGIPDFRSEKGIYRVQRQYGYPPEVMLSHTFFVGHTAEFYRFYRETMLYPDAKPNQAHLALAALEKQGKLKTVITQNIDGLHQLAGSECVLELHGSVYRNYCMDCGAGYALEYVISAKETVPRCTQCNGVIKPDVVLYEEPLREGILGQSVEYITHADVMIVGGTSLSVYPAAGLVDYYRGNQLVLINKSETPYDEHADLVIHDSIGGILSQVA